MYLHAWKAGLKTTYYLRSPAGHPHQPDHHGRRRQRPPPPTPSAVGGGDAGSGSRRAYTDEEAVACSLENPESCEACQ